VLGKPWFFVVFVLDFAKGFGPTMVARTIENARGEQAEGLAVAAGVAAVLGHVFSLFLRFKGGKGVATAAGVFAALAPIAAGIAFVAWFVVAKASGYVSLASLAAAIALPLACWLLPLWHVPVAPGVRWVALLVGALIVIRHRANIGRLLRGQEPRAR
jgi:glycerol-3-phosphate acyltransferase PlsY